MVKKMKACCKKNVVYVVYFVLGAGAACVKIFAASSTIYRRAKYFFIRARPSTMCFIDDA
jgi:hypothetical protein